MSTKPETVAFLKEQLIAAGDIRLRPMFGEYGMYLGEKMVAIVGDDALFVKKTERGSRMLGPEHEAPPYPGAKPALQVPEEKLQDHEWLCRLIVATAEALPEPKPKGSKRRG